MIAYSIKDLEGLSGVKAHTLRIWEKRYGIIKPSRTSTNIRFYKDEDLQNILNISLLNRKGYKISRIANMQPAQLRAKVLELTEVSSEFEDQIDTMVLSMFDLEEARFNIILDQYIQKNGFEETMNDVVYPLLDKLSVMWISGSVKGVHENFVTNIIRKKTIVQIERLSRQNFSSPLRCIIYLPENETHELSVLFLEYILLKNKVKVINLGSSLPLIDVLEGVKIFKANMIFTMFNDSFSETPLQPYINELSKNCPDQKIVIGGYQTSAQPLELPDNVMIKNGIDPIKELIQEFLAKNG